MLALKHLEPPQQIDSTNKQALTNKAPLTLLHAHTLAHNPYLFVHQIQTVTGDDLLTALEQRRLHLIVLQNLDQGITQALDLNTVRHAVYKLDRVYMSADIIQQADDVFGLIQRVLDQVFPQVLVVVLLAELHCLVDVLDGVQDELEGLLDLAHSLEDVDNLWHEVAFLELLLRLGQAYELAVLEEGKELLALVLGVEDDLHGVEGLGKVRLSVENGVEVVVEVELVLGELVDDAFDW